LTFIFEFLPPQIVKTFSHFFSHLALTDGFFKAVIQRDREKERENEIDEEKKNHHLTCFAGGFESLDAIEPSSHGSPLSSRQK